MAPKHDSVDGQMPRITSNPVRRFEYLTNRLYFVKTAPAVRPFLIYTRTRLVYPPVGVEFSRPCFYWQ
jgi:hypothetical protein